MNTPPATRKEFWDRMIQLNQDTGGKFTIEQVRETFAMPPERLAEIGDRLKNAFSPTRDIISLYETAHDNVQRWKGSILRQLDFEEKSSSYTRQRDTDLMQVSFSAGRELRDADHQDRETLALIVRKYMTLDWAYERRLLDDGQSHG